jgi:hypothetical protein
VQGNSVGSVADSDGPPTHLASGKVHPLQVAKGVTLSAWQVGRLDLGKLAESVRKTFLALGLLDPLRRLSHLAHSQTVAVRQLFSVAWHGWHTSAFVSRDSMNRLCQHSAHSAD